VDQHESPADSVSPALRFRIYGQQRRHDRKHISGNSVHHLYGLLDHVNSTRLHPFRKQPPRRPFARSILSNPPLCTRPPGNHSGPKRTLQVNANVISLISQLPPYVPHIPQSIRAQW
jgi:hypothetical protein